MAPGSPSDAAARVKEAAKGAKDLVPDNVSDAATAASKATNSFSGFFGGAQKFMTLGLRDLLVYFAGWWYCKDIYKVIVSKCAYRSAAAKDKAEDVAPGSPSDAAARVKEAAKGAKDLVPDNVSDAATAASKATNSFSGFFGGAQKFMTLGLRDLLVYFAGWWYCKDIYKVIVSKCAYRCAAAKDKAEDVAPGSPSDAAARVKEAAKGAKDLVPDNVSDAATAASKATNSFSGFFGGAQKFMTLGLRDLLVYFAGYSKDVSKVIVT